MEASKENTPPRSLLPRFLHHRPKSAEGLPELAEKLNQVEKKVEEAMAEEQKLRNEVLEMAPRAMEQYLDTRFDRLMKAKLNFAQDDKCEEAEKDELEKAKESLRQLKLDAAREEEQQKRELEESLRIELELKQRVNWKLDLLKALEE